MEYAIPTTVPTVRVRHHRIMSSPSLLREGKCTKSTKTEDLLTTTVMKIWVQPVQSVFRQPMEDTWWKWTYSTKLYAELRLRNANKEQASFYAH